MIYRFGNYELDAQRCELRCAGQLVAIEPKVLEVLVYLLQPRDRVVTKEELLEQGWSGTFVSEAALTRCLAKVRKTVQPEPTGPPVIMIVDDEPLNVDYLEQELEELGYATIRAANGQEALEKVAAEAPDLILLDVMMPVLDGFTVCRILKDHEETRLIPIIMMTALDAVADRIQGIKAGADDFLTKPVHEEELFARIATALKLKHTVDRRIGELRALKDHFAKFVRLVTTPEASSS